MEEVLPGQWVSIRKDGNCLKMWDVAKVFNIERGGYEVLYGLYNYEKECWELLDRSYFR